MASVVLIETGEDKARPNPINRGNAAPPYALESLAGFVIDKESLKDPEFRHEVHIIQQEQLKKEEIPNYTGEDLSISPQIIAGMVAKMKEPVIIGIRAVSPLYNDALIVAKTIKELVPRAKIILGGYHASGTVSGEGENRKSLIYKSKKYNKWEQELKHKIESKNIQLVDCFVVGEGEQTLYDLVEKFSECGDETNTELLKDVKGIVYRDQNSNDEFLNEERDRLGQDNEGYKFYDPPEPYRRITIPLLDEKGNVTGYREIPSSVGRLQTGTEIPHQDIREIQSNYTRGCPHDCAFCDSSCVWSRQLTFRNLKKVVEEIAKLKQDPEYKINYIYFADLTFNMASVHLNELTKYMQNVRIRDNGEVYYIDELDEAEITSDKNNGEKVFGHGDTDLVHWFGLEQLFHFLNQSDTVDPAFKSNLTVGDRSTRVTEVISSVSDGFLQSMGYSVNDFSKLLEDDPSGLYDRIECISDTLKQELCKILGDMPKEKITGALFNYLGFPDRIGLDPRELLHSMREAGCAKLGFGIEGFSLHDIVTQKSLDHRLSGGITDYEYSPEAIRQQGIERFAQTSMTLKMTKSEGIFTRGYFIWGSETQNEYTFDRAKLLLSIEIPDVIFNNYDHLKELVGVMFDEINKFYPENIEDEGTIEKVDLNEAKDRIKQVVDNYAREKYDNQEINIEDRSRFLDIDHLRIGYETPYLSTEAGRERKMRCADAYRNEENVLIRDAGSKLVYRRCITVDNEDIELEARMDKDNLPHYHYPEDERIDIDKKGQEVEPEILRSADYIENLEVKGKTLQELTQEEGWDDWEYLFQESPVLESGVSLKELMEQPNQLVEYFYTCDEYKRSMEDRINRFPEQKEAVYAWQKFWEDAKKLYFLNEDTMKEISDNIVERAKKMIGIEKEDLEYWLKERILTQYMPDVNEIISEMNEIDSQKENISETIAYDMPLK